MKITDKDIFKMGICAITLISYFIIITGCGRQREYNNLNRAYFEIDSITRVMILPVTINDSVTVKMAFDTGASLGAFQIDSAFCAHNPLHLWKQEPDYIWKAGGSAWTHAVPQTKMLVYKTPFTAKIGESCSNHEELAVWNREAYYGKLNENGLFNIPQTDTTHVWELNFEHDYLELHDAEAFTMPEDCLIAPFSRNSTKNMYVTIPLSIKDYSGETLNMNRDFLVDTGMAWDVAIVSPAEELSFFEGKEAIRMAGQNHINRHIVAADIMNGFHMDSLRIYTMKESYRLPTQYLIGLNFLKRFNVFIDMKGRRMGLQPLKVFRRAHSPSWRPFRIDVSRTERGSYLVTELADGEFNYYKTAGMKVGDEIITINGVSLHNGVTSEEVNKLLQNQKLDIYVIREGEQMQIIVERDQDEEGD